MINWEREWIDTKRDLAAKYRIIAPWLIVTLYLICLWSSDPDVVTWLLISALMLRWMVGDGENK